MRWFAYNGDADGICSMVQWGLVHGIEGNRVTGVKRDIMLLDRISPNSGDEVIVMDISHARNEKRASEISSSGIAITWFDHHLAGDLGNEIQSFIDTSPNVCTAKLVEKFLNIPSDWSEVALHGDGLSRHSVKPELKELGELLNYNGYGGSLDDLHFHPDDLMLKCLHSKSPEEFMKTETFRILKNGFTKDIENCESIGKIDGIFLLPNLPWARRAVGVFAHRVFEKLGGTQVIAIDMGEHLQVSIRGDSGIGELCAKFGGGGRQTAGGIDSLPKNQIPQLMNEVNSR